MDSLHVSGGGGAHQQQANSKTSSRSASPCRPRATEQQEQRPQQEQRQQQSGTSGGGTATTHTTHHHAKTLSHGSADSAKSQDVSQQRGATTRHRSPTTSTNRTMESSEDSTSATTVHHLHHHLISQDDSLTYPEGGGGNAGDDSDVCFAATSFLSNGSSEHALPYGDEADSSGLVGANVRTTNAIEHLNNKIKGTMDNIRLEQMLRDDNVNEYLQLAANADKQQLQRIKAVFEKKNQKSAHTIAQLQKKLDNYQKRLREYEKHGVIQTHRPPREVLRDMGQGLKNVGGNIRDGITGFSGSVMSKPREFAHLIKNKFGSADNINQLSTWYIGPGATASGSSDGTQGGGGTGSDKADKSHHGSATLPANLHAGMSQTSMSGGPGGGGSGGAVQNVGAGTTQHHKFPSDEGSECSSVTSESIERYRRQQDGGQVVGGSTGLSINTIFGKLQARQEEIDRLRERVEATKGLQQEVQFLSAALQEERFRTERLEEQINDLTELHQNEVENLKQAMVDMEEKVQYQSEERLRDIHEMLEHCQTKIQKMEHQAAQQQQYVTLEGLDNSNARALVVKLINVLLTVLQVVLLLVATGAGIIMPFLRTRENSKTVTVTEVVAETRSMIMPAADARTCILTRTVTKT